MFLGSLQKAVISAAGFVAVANAALYVNKSLPSFDLEDLTLREVGARDTLVGIL